jgi:aminoglycoside phosphotransferase family enzyme
MHRIIAMPSMIDDLLDPSSLPDKTDTVSVVQTHISVVLIADHFVYKIKKPVNFGFLDFSTLEKRRYYCEQEVRLNRRLSEGLYVGVLPVIYDGERHKLGDDGGEAVEFAVKMRRIPDRMLMKSVFQRGELRDVHLRKIASVLAQFHRTARNSPEIDQFGLPRSFKVNTDENFAQTERYIDTTIQREDFDAIQAWTDRFYRARKALFLDRIEAKRIRDCHGDLHMEHICLTDAICIFDCIEFNDRFRYSDTLSDIAFLLMDLEYHGGEAFAGRLWGLYKDLADEGDVNLLLAFYKVYRAYVRGKVTSFQLDDEHIGADMKTEALQTARRYFKLARGYVGGGN